MLRRTQLYTSVRNGLVVGMPTEGVNPTCARVLCAPYGDEPPPEALTLTGTPDAGVDGTAYSFTPATAGGTAPYSYALAAGSDPLPFGWTLDAGTGELASAGPVEGTVNLTIEVTDSGDPAQTATLPVEIVIAAP